MKSKKNQKISLPKLLPNIFTTIGLCSGLTGIRLHLMVIGQMQFYAFWLPPASDMIDGLSIDC